MGKEKIEQESVSSLTSTSLMNKKMLYFRNLARIIFYIRPNSPCELITVHRFCGPKTDSCRSEPTRSDRKWCCQTPNAPD